MVVNTKEEGIEAFFEQYFDYKNTAITFLDHVQEQVRKGNIDLIGKDLGEIASAIYTTTFAYEVLEGKVKDVCLVEEDIPNEEVESYFINFPIEDNDQRRIMSMGRLTKAANEFYLMHSADLKIIERLDKLFIEYINNFEEHKDFMKANIMSRMGLGTEWDRYIEMNEE